MEKRTAGDRGQTIPLLALLLAAVIGAMALIAHLGVAATLKAKARTVADAAALAGAAEGRRAADDIARANGGEVVRFEQRGSDALVVARVREATAKARARREMLSPRDELSPAFRAAIARAEQLLGEPIVVVPSGGEGIEVEAPVGDRLATVAVEAGLCRSGPTRFVICPMP